MATFTSKQLREKFIKSDLEQKLQKDKNGTFRDRVLDDLSDSVDQLREEHRLGLSPDDYGRYEKLLAGLRVAEQVVRRTWNACHTSQLN